MFDSNDPRHEMPTRTARRFIVGAFAVVVAVVVIGLVAGHPPSPWPKGPPPDIYTVSAP